jgi:ADP-ribose pyrophosphatase YjhB (NUDIX family)
LSHFCLQCGTKLRARQIEGREREYCPGCGWINYQNLKISAGCRITADGRILLVKRRNPPFAETWHFPSGYVEVDEYPAAAAERETREETGLQVKAGKLVGAYFYNDDPRGNGVVMFFDAEIIEGELCPSDETSDVRFFSPCELSQIPIAGMSAEASIREWMEEQAFV